MKNLMLILLNLKYWLLVLGIVWIADLALMPYIDPYFFKIIILSGIGIILAVSLNLINGHTGQFSMGHAGFMAVGGYVSALTTILVQNLVLGNLAAQNLIFLLALLLGGTSAALIGFFVGLPSLRLRGDYLAIVTLGFGEIIRVVVLNLDLVGGSRGLAGIPKYSNFGWVFTFAVITIFFCWRIVNTSYGRAFLSVRDDEIAAEAVGVPTTRAKVKSFVIGAFFAGLAGGLFAHDLQYLSPSIFDFNRSFEIIIMVVLGGMGSISGSVIAAVFLTVLKEALRPLQEMTGVDLRMIVYSLLLIIIMLTRPNGLLGKREVSEILMSWKKKVS
ncbi:MAG: branched-chain amino acid ABC transporter permease [Bdellovibrionales bacterium]|nr:branched-chain amino acid ABC transporter permease [Bdellovibrionales bacterium]